MTEATTAAALAGPLRALIDHLDAGDLTAGPLARAYLAGALAALDAVDGSVPVPLPDLDA